MRLLAAIGELTDGILQTSSTRMAAAQLGLGTELRFFKRYRPKCFGSTEYQNMPRLSVPTFGTQRLIT